jgi:GT2 family glycosyltransferase
VTRPLDIVIPTYNRPHRIPALVNALARQCRECDTIIVVWQGSSLNRSGLPECTVHLQAPWPNLPAARNCGVRASHADIILFVDDDTVPADGLVDAHRSCYDAPAVAGVAGCVDDPLFDRTRRLPSFIDLTIGECIQNFSLDTSQPAASAMGANMSFRRDALLSAGGFDERYRGNALWEEVDLCLRLLAKGLSIWYCAEAKVVHDREERGGCRDLKRYRYLYHEFANTAYFAARFAKVRHYLLWLTFWKHRLEYRSRKCAGGRTLHDPFAVLAGVTGAAGGMFRHLGSKIMTSQKIPRVNRAAVTDALKLLGSAVAP